MTYLQAAKIAAIVHDTNLRAISKRLGMSEPPITRALQGITTSKKIISYFDTLIITAFQQLGTDFINIHALPKGSTIHSRHHPLIQNQNQEDQ